jgi:hypothetical protein
MFRDIDYTYSTPSQEMWLVSFNSLSITSSYDFFAFQRQRLIITARYLMSTLGDLQKPMASSISMIKESDYGDFITLGLRSNLRSDLHFEQRK